MTASVNETSMVAGNMRGGGTSMMSSSACPCILSEPGAMHLLSFSFILTAVYVQHA